MALWNRKSNAQQAAEAEEAEEQSQPGPEEAEEPQTGPLPQKKRATFSIPKIEFGGFGWKRSPKTSSAGQPASQEDPRELTPLEKQRALVESFNEDALGFLDKAKLGAAKLASILLPLIAVYAIGGELGQYFAGNKGFDLHNQWIASQYLLGYAGEFTLAVMTYVLGHAFSQRESGPGHAAKLFMTTIIWLVFLAASAAGQWYVSKATLHPDQAMKVALAVRIIMASCLDIAAVCLMWWRGKSLGKFLAEQQKKAESIRAVNESELAIEAAQEAAERRRKEDEQYLEAKRSHNQMMITIQELQNAALIKQAEQALLGGPGGSRDRSNW